MSHNIYENYKKRFTVTKYVAADKKPHYQFTILTSNGSYTDLTQDEVITLATELMLSLTAEEIANTLCNRGDNDD